MSNPRVIVVTGASVGIGAAILKMQAEKGNIVVGLARRVENIEKIRDENPDLKIYGLKADLAVDDDIIKAFDWIKTNLEKIDVLINNAGVLKPTFVLDCEIQHWRSMFNINVFAVGLCTREAVKILAEDGHIVNISSIAGTKILNISEYLAYSSTKHALKVLTEGMRIELNKVKPKARVTIISPGAVYTDMISHYLEDNKDQNPPFIEAVDVANSIDHVITTPFSVNVTELTIRAPNELM